MPEVFLTEDNLVLPRARNRLYTLILSGLLAKNCGRLCQEKLKSPNHWRFLKEISTRLKRLIAAVNYVKVLF